LKLVRFGPVGQEKPGLIDKDGVLRDLSSVVPDIGATQLSRHSLATLAKLDSSSLPVVDAAQRIGCPIAHVGKLVAIGLNYYDHAKEVGAPIPQEPVIFMKATSCIQGPDDDVMLPEGSEKCDWEVELGIVIGERARYVEEAQALDYVAGYCVVNDVSERDYQLERGGTWDKGKGCDTFGPIGPWLVTGDEIANPQTLSLWLDVNGKRMQTGSTETMIFNVKQIVSYVSRFMTLLPGDIITTGTPPGVGLGMKPPVFLREGDVMTLGIEGLGEQRQKVVAFKR
jgi:2,4-diketo-3-deoxy-L-fuconate hydrolase